MSQSPARSKTAPVVVIGGGGHAKVVVATLQALGHAILGIFDDHPARRQTRILGIPVLGPTQDAAAYGDARGVIAIGDAAIRRRLAGTLPLRWLTLVHPAATVHPSVRLGPGSVVCAGAIVQPDARLGCHAIINTCASVDHDSIVGDFVHLAPGVRLAGHVTVGDDCFIGAGAVVIPGVAIGDGSILGAGSVAVRNPPGGTVAFGNPARPRRLVRTEQAA